MARAAESLFFHQVIEFAGKRIETYTNKDTPGYKEAKLNGSGAHDIDTVEIDVDGCFVNVALLDKSTRYISYNDLSQLIEMRKGEAYDLLYNLRRNIIRGYSRGIQEFLEGNNSSN